MSILTLIGLVVVMVVFFAILGPMIDNLSTTSFCVLYIGVMIRCLCSGALLVGMPMLIIGFLISLEPIVKCIGKTVLKIKEFFITVSRFFVSDDE